MDTAVQLNPRTNFHLHRVESSTSTTASKTSLTGLKIKAQVEAFKSATFDFIECENRQQYDLLPAKAEEVVNRMAGIVGSLHLCLGKYAILSQEEKDAIGIKVRRELAPYILLAHVGNRMYHKPRGYAGDCLTIAEMYKNVEQGVNRIGQLIDRTILDNPAAKAVRNRRALLAEVIRETVNRCSGSTTHITSFACGPAAELFDVNEQLNDEKVTANLIDIDLQALAHVGARVEQEEMQINIRLHQQKLIHLALGRKEIKLEPQDLIYSIGLIDYFEDKLVIKLINYAYDRLNEGGQLVLGNFHNENPIKAYMDYVLDWKLIHRSEKDMHNLFKASKFGKDCTEIRYENEGINMFAFCTK